MRNAHFTRRGGFSLRDLLLVIIGVTAVMVVVLPRMARPRGCVLRMTCTNNLKQLGIGFGSSIMDGKWEPAMQVSVTNGGVMELAETGSAHAVFLAMSNDIVTPKILFCPEDQTPHRRMANIWEATIPPNASAGTIPFTETNSLSYFLGVDATDVEPQRIFSGDDHFQVAKGRPKPGLLLLATNASVTWRNERHPKRGNILLADASVQDFNSVEFMKQFVKTGLATNRLAMP